MKSRAYRSLAALLMAVFVATSLPTGYADATANEPQQSSSTNRARRGKNGNATTSAPAQPARADEQDAERDSQPPSSSRSSSAGDQSSKTTRNQPADADQQSSQPAQKKEPPPFDRPPINSTSRPSSEQPAQPSQTDSAPPYQPPSRDRSSRQSEPQYDTDRRQQSPPTMRRERNPNPDSSTTDVDNDQPARNDRQRPVLRRQNDPEPQTNQGGNTGRPQSNPSDPANRPEANPDDEVIRLESTLVNIPLLVSDRSGRYISRLNKNDFTLYEDGVLQEIATFTSEEVPFNVVLLLDMSPSVQGSTESIHDAAIAFVRQMRPQDRVMVASFDRNVQFLTDFISDRRMLEQAIRSTHTGAGTSVYDAVYETVARRLSNVEGRKALILFSDGEDTTSSRASYDDAVEIVSESDVLVYGLRYPGSGSIQVNPWPRDPWPQIPFPIPWPWPRRRRGPFTLNNITSNLNNAASPAPQWPRNRGGRGNGDFMADITAAGGGPVYDAQQINDLSRLAFQIAEELRNTYTVSYYPKNNLSNGGYRSIRVRVRSRDDLAVRHRKGYDAGNVHKPSRI